MNHQTILKLINSSNFDDLRLGMTFLSHLDDPHEFFKLYGEKIDFLEEVEIKTYPLRYQIKIDKWWDDEKVCYFKLKENYYIINSRNYLIECHKPYSNLLKIIDETIKE